MSEPASGMYAEVFMIKKVLCFFIAAMLLSISIVMSIALAGAVPAKVTLAAAPFDHTAFKKYSVYQYDPDSGDWNVRANEVTAALMFIDAEAGGYSDGLCYFYLEITGNARTGMVIPVLNVIYTGTKAVNASAISFRVGSVRYDFAAAREPAAVISRKADLIRIPLDNAGIAMLNEMLSAGSAHVFVHGDVKYTCEAAVKDKYKNSKEQIEALSLINLGPMLTELSAIGMDHYGLWDLNAALWELNAGFRPHMDSAELYGGGDYNGLELDKTFNMLSPGVTGKSVTALQNRLIELHYMEGKTDGKYGDATVAAIRAIQKYMGMVETGSVDRALCDALFIDGILPAEAATTVTSALPLDNLGTVELRVDRYWFAPAVIATKSGGALAMRGAANLDNILMIFDGAVRNSGVQALELNWQMSAAITYENMYTFSCSLTCERDEGSGFGESLIPLAESRLVIYAEIPKALAASAGKWALRIGMGDDSLNWNVVGTH